MCRSSGTLPLLRDRATTDNDQNVRQVAVQAITVMRLSMTLRNIDTALWVSDMAFAPRSLPGRKISRTDLPRRGLRWRGLPFVVWTEYLVGVTHRGPVAGVLRPSPGAEALHLVECLDEAPVRSLVDKEAANRWERWVAAERVLQVCQADLLLVIEDGIRLEIAIPDE